MGIFYHRQHTEQDTQRSGWYIEGRDVGPFLSENEARAYNENYPPGFIPCMGCGTAVADEGQEICSVCGERVHDLD